MGRLWDAPVALCSRRSSDVDDHLLELCRMLGLWHWSAQHACMSVYELVCIEPNRVYVLQECSHCSALQKALYTAKMLQQAAANITRGAEGTAISILQEYSKSP